MDAKRRKLVNLAGTLLRWGVAVVGIAWVVSGLVLRDQVLVLDARNLPQQRVYLGGSRAEGTFTVRDPATGGPTTVDADRVVNDADRKAVDVDLDGAVRTVPLLGMRLGGERASGDFDRSPVVERLLVKDPETGRGRWVPPSAVASAGGSAGGFVLKVPQPTVETGLISLVRGANPWLLAASVAVFPITYLMTTLRWHRLLGGLGLDVSLGRALALNLVGSFYNLILLVGSTSGDVLKAFYAARQTGKKTYAVMSVLVDRVIGLATLVVMGGGAAAFQWLASGDRSDPTAVACRQVAIGTALISLGLLAGAAVVASRTLRRVSGIDAVVGRLPMRDKVRGIIKVLETYAHDPGLMLWAMAVTVPVHLTTIVSAMLAGWAFDLPIATPFYFVAVPVIVLVGSVPISPQGAGVMEFFAVTLTARQGATVGQAFALTMSIRLVQMFWNLLAGVAVLRGGYAQPSDAEREDAFDEVAEPQAPSPAVAV